MSEKVENRPVEAGSEMYSSLNAGKSRKLTLVCPICRRQEVRNMTNKAIFENMFFCHACEIPIQIYDENGKLVCGGFPISVAPPIDL